MYLAFPVSVRVNLRASEVCQALIETHVQGANREVKKAVEAYWAGKISADELTKAASEVKKYNWTNLKARGVDFVPRSVSPNRFDLHRPSMKHALRLLLIAATSRSTITFLITPQPSM